jgi:hypothetical protein
LIRLDQSRDRRVPVPIGLFRQVPRSPIFAPQQNNSFVNWTRSIYLYIKFGIFSSRSYSAYYICTHVNPSCCKLYRVVKSTICCPSYLFILNIVQGARWWCTFFCTSVSLYYYCACRKYCTWNSLNRSSYCSKTSWREMYRERAPRAINNAIISNIATQIDCVCFTFLLARTAFWMVLILF